VLLIGVPERNLESEREKERGREREGEREIRRMLEESERGRQRSF
jgi:hypothetical protein